MATVFVSHASQDTEVARTVVAYLEESGIACWLATRDVDASDDYAEQIIRAIEDAVAFVVLVSTAADHSPHVRIELDRAVSTSRRIVAVRLGGTIVTETLSYYLAGTQWLELPTSPSLGELQKLAEVIRRRPTGLPHREPAPFHEILSRGVTPVAITQRHPMATFALFCTLTLVLSPIGLLFGTIYLLRRDQPAEGRLVAYWAVFVAIVIITLAVAGGIAYYVSQR
jgi:hypothetical protein